MTITVTEEFTFNELQDRCWSGAIHTLNEIADANKEAEFMSYLNGIFCSDAELPTITTINDFLWFESDTIFEDLGIVVDD